MTSDNSRRRFSGTWSSHHPTIATSTATSRSARLSPIHLATSATSVLPVRRSWWLRTWQSCGHHSGFCRRGPIRRHERGERLKSTPLDLSGPRRRGVRRRTVCEMQRMPGLGKTQSERCSCGRDAGPPLHRLDVAPLAAMPTANARPRLSACLVANDWARASF
jgi:hypothetical protein